jgi:hypothetical protein
MLAVKHFHLSEIYDSYDGEHKNYCLLRCDACGL